MLSTLERAFNDYYKEPASFTGDAPTHPTSCGQECDERSSCGLCGDPACHVHPGEEDAEVVTCPTAGDVHSVCHAQACNSPECWD